MFATKLREFRDRAGMTGAQLAAAAGLSRPFLWRLEAAKNEPSFLVACQLADALGVSVADFRGENKSRKK